VENQKRGRKKRKIGQNLLIQLRNYKEDTLRFLWNPCVSFTNNLAERDLRMVKIKQKISGGFRTMKGAEDFAILRGFLSSARKQNLNLLTALSNPQLLTTRVVTKKIKQSSPRSIKLTAFFSREQSSIYFLLLTNSFNRL
jgi:transposase